MLDDIRQNTASAQCGLHCGAFTNRGEQLLIDNWMINTDPGFVNAANSNYSLREDTPVYKRIPRFEAIPFEKIGLYKKEYRRYLP